MMRGRKIIILDLDDTLYKEIDFLRSAFQEIAFYIGIPDTYGRMLRYWQQGENVFERIIVDYNLNMSINELLRVYREHKPDITLDVETVKTLDKLSKSCILGIITDGRSLTQRNKVVALGLDEYISGENILVSEETGFEKPSQVPYQIIMNKFPHCTYWYVGDNPTKDFLAPNQLGWNTICLLDDGRNIHKQTFSLDSQFLPKFRIRKLTEVLDFVCDL